MYIPSYGYSLKYICHQKKRFKLHVLQQTCISIHKGHAKDRSKLISYACLAPILNRIVENFHDMSWQIQGTISCMQLPFNSCTNIYWYRKDHKSCTNPCIGQLRISMTMSCPDAVQGKISCPKLYGINFKGKPLMWITPFLSNHIQSIVVNGVSSSPCALLGYHMDQSLGLSYFCYTSMAQLQIGLCQLCRHNFQHNRGWKA